MNIEEFLSKYETHEAEISKIKYNPIKQTLSFNLYYEGWSKEQHEKEGLFFSSLDVVFYGVTNLDTICNKTTVTSNRVEHSTTEAAPIETIKELLLGIYRDGDNVVSILVDDDFYKNTIIKFVAESVTVKENK